MEDPVLNALLREPTARCNKSLLVLDSEHDKVGMDLIERDEFPAGRNAGMDGLNGLMA